MRKLLNYFTIFITKPLNCVPAARCASAFMALCMLVNITGQAAAQAYKTDFSNYNPKAFKAVQDNTRVAYPRLDAQLMAAKAKSAASSNALSYEQVKNLISNHLKAYNLPNSLAEADYQNLYASYIKDINKNEAEVNKAYKLLKNEYHLDFVWKDYANAKNGKICNNGVCVEADAYMQGALRAELYSAVGIGSEKQYQWNDDIMLSGINNIYNLFSEHGATVKDIPLLRKYLRTMLSRAPKYCDNDFYLVDYMPGLGTSISGKSNGKKSDAENGKNRRLKQCRGAGLAATALAMLDVPAEQKNADTDLIYNTLKDNYKKDYGAILLADCSSALVLTGGKRALGYLDSFLLDTSLKDGLSKRTVWQSLWKVLDVFSIKAWVDTATNINNTSRGRGGRYLNDTGLKFQYLDTDAAREWGISDFTVSVAKDNPSLGYNVPYGNILEDLGVIIASSNDASAKALSNKIVNLYYNRLKNGQTAYSAVHTPLVTGVLKSGKVKSGQAAFAAAKLNKLDWWDLNEATQRRINNSVSAAFGLPKYSINEAKKMRADRNRNIAQLSVWADMAVNAIFIAMLIKSIPSIIKGAGSLLQTAARVKNIQAAGKLSLLRTVRANIKVSGVNPNAVKLANYNRALEKSKAAAASAKKIAPKINFAPEVKQPRKINKNQIVITEARPGVAEIKFKWQLKQQAKPALNKTTALTAQVGEGGGASAAAQPALTAIKPEPIKYAGYNPPAGTPARVYFPKPAKIIENSRIKTALFKANIDHGLNVLNQFKNSLKTKFGATLFAVNLSLTNPVMLNAAESGKAFAIIENIAGSERVAFTSAKALRNVAAAPSVTVESVKTLKAPEILNTSSNLLKPAKALPDYKPLAAAAAMLPLAMPKYYTFNNTLEQKKTFSSHSTTAAIPYALQTKEEATAISQEETKQLRPTVAHIAPLAPANVPLYGFAQSDPVIPLILIYTAAKKSLSGKIHKHAKANTPAPVYRDLNSPSSGFFGSNIKLPKGYDKKKGVETYYINNTGEEIKLPLLFNIDKAIKVNNSQRGVFNAQNRLEIRNGNKKPLAIEGFCMLLENTPRAKVSFLNAVRKAALPTPFQLKLHFTSSKMSKHLKEVPFQTANNKGASYIKLLAPRNMVKDGEILTINRDGSLTAKNAAGEERVLPDFTFRVPKSEIGNLIKVLTVNDKNFVLDIIPTQNKTLPFMLTFLASTTIMAVAPAFKEVFALSDFWTNTIMGLISFGPALSIPFLGHFFKNYGVSKVMKAAAIMSFAGIALATAAGFYGYAGHSASIVSLVAASIGLLMLSLSNEIKFSSMSPLIESNFEPHKALALTTKSLMARSLGTILFLQFAPLYNLIATHLGFAKADDTIAFALFLLPVAFAAAVKMSSTKLREVPALPENNISVKSLIKIVKDNKEIRNGALAFTMFESFEATLSLLLFSVAKEHFGALSSAPSVIGGVAIYAAMVIGRYVASCLQKKGSLDGQKTLLTTFAAMALGTILFATCGVSVPGLIGAAIAFMGVSNTFAPLFNVTSKRNPNKSSEISLLFFTTTTLALISTILLGGIIDATGSQQAGFIVPLASIAAALYLAKYVFKDMPLLKTLKKKAVPSSKAKAAKKEVKKEAPQEEKPAEDNTPLPN